MRKESENVSLKYFGTDGFRGEYGTELTDGHAEAIGRCLGTYYGGSEAEILIGHDTRASSPLLESALIRGITSAGGTAFRLGVFPTPAVSFMTKHSGADAAVMITASHNPASDNGIKIFDERGEKLSDGIIAICEKFIDEKEKISKAEDLIKEDASVDGAKFVNVQHLIMRWEKQMISSTDGLDGLKIGLDCANGATYDAAPRIFRALGAKVYTIGTSPDGDNINHEVGSTHPEALATMVRQEGLDMGFAFDGDGDRCIAVDRSGRIIDGDGEMFILAKDMMTAKTLKDRTVVCTIMSNGGFIKSLEKIGIKCEITPVGDRFVFEKMKECGATLGGEQSGHIITENSDGGNGIYTAIRIAELSKATGKSLLELADGLTVFPQITRNVKVANKELVMQDKVLIEAVNSASAEIGDLGRIVLRPSGTENLIRLMIEHENYNKCKLYIEKIAKIIKERGDVPKNENQEH